LELIINQCHIIKKRIINKDLVLDQNLHKKENKGIFNVEEQENQDSMIQMFLQFHRHNKIKYQLGIIFRYLEIKQEIN